MRKLTLDEEIFLREGAAKVKKRREENKRAVFKHMLDSGQITSEEYLKYMSNPPGIVINKPSYVYTEKEE